MSARRRFYEWWHRFHCRWGVHGYWCGYWYAKEDQ